MNQDLENEKLIIIKEIYKNTAQCAENSKIFILFKNWLETFNFLLNNKSILSDLDIESIGRYDLYDIVEESFVLSEQKNHTIKFKSLKLLIGTIYLKFTNKIYLPGSNHITNKIKFIISQFAIIYLIDSIKINYDALARFKKSIHNLNLNKLDKKLLIDLLPTEFFIEKKILSKNLSLNLIGSPISLRDKQLIKLLAYDRNINLIGIQHGCNYGLYKINNIEKFERLISDRYLYWLISNNNVKISRYKNCTNNSIFNKSEIYWIGRPVISKYFSEQIPVLNSLRKNTNLKNINFIYSNIKDINFKLIPHIHKNSSIFYSDIEKKYLFRPNIRLETYLKKNAKILIFDVINSSLIYFAIASSIPFLVVCDKLKIMDKGEHYDKFIRLLQSIKSIHNIGDGTNFKSEIVRLTNDNKYYKERIKIINKYKKDLNFNTINF